MTTRSEAFARPFPAGPEWAAKARSRLGLDGGDGERIRDIAQGWMRLGSTQDAVLVDTLFVLTTDQIGFGQIKFETTDPNWVTLSSVQAMDLIEGVPYPLDAVEVQFVGGLAIFVGWPEHFTTSVVTALRVHGSARRQAARAAAAAAGQTVSSSPMPPLFAPADRPPPAPVAAQPRATEPEAAAPEPEPEMAEPVPAEPEMAEPEAVEPEPAEPTALETDGASEPEPAADETSDQVSAEEAFFGHLEPDLHEPAAMFSVEPGPVDTDLPTVPDSAPDVAGPWDDPSITWPEAFRDCAFLGGHPVHQRRRKSCTVVLTRRGLVAATSGIGAWSVHAPWQDVARLDVQGSDEIKFTHNQRIGSNASVLVVDLSDGSSLLFEVRDKRPATLTSLVAPVQAAVNRTRRRDDPGGSAERDAS